MTATETAEQRGLDDGSGPIAKVVVAAVVLVIIAGVAWFVSSLLADDESVPPRVRQHDVVIAFEHTVFQVDPVTLAAQRDALDTAMDRCKDLEVWCRVSLLIANGDSSGAIDLVAPTDLRGNDEAAIETDDVWRAQSRRLGDERADVVDEFAARAAALLESAEVVSGCTNLLGTVRSVLDQLDDADESGPSSREVVLMASGNSNCPPTILLGADGTSPSPEEVRTAARTFAAPGSADGTEIRFVCFGRTFLAENRQPTVAERDRLADIWRELANLWGFDMPSSPFDGGCAP